VKQNLGKLECELMNFERIKTEVSGVLILLFLSLL
jgi:hypothetical protein